jgi:hypothetical protein
MIFNIEIMMPTQHANIYQRNSRKNNQYLNNREKIKKKISNQSYFNDKQKKVEGIYNNKLFSKKAHKNLFTSNLLNDQNTQLVVLSAEENNLGHLLGKIILQIAEGQNIGKNFFLLMLWLAILPKVKTQASQKKTVPFNYAFTSNDKFNEKPTDTKNINTNNNTIFSNTNIQQEQSIIQKYLKKRTFIDPNVSPLIKNTVIKNCQEINNKIINLTEKLPHTASYILKTVRQKSFKIVCSSRQRMNDIEGIFNISKEKLILPLDDLDLLNLNTIHHEFIHAINYFSQKNDRCQDTNFFRTLDNRVAPIFPVNKNNIKIYNEAFDVGDKRVNKFKELWKKEKQVKLNETELTELKRYMTASKGCILEPSKIEISQTKYEMYTNLGLKDNEKISHFIQMPTEFALKTEFWLGSYEIVRIHKTHLKENQYKYYAFIKPRYPEQAILALPERIKIILATNYKNSSTLSNLIEREAFTFESLSESAIKTFYPEAKKLRDTFLEKCSGVTSKLQLVL